MAITESHRTNFDTLQEAFDSGDVGLVEVYDTLLDRVSVAIVAFGQDGDEVTMTPFALCFEENPFERLRPPDPAGGFHEEE